MGGTLSFVVWWVQVGVDRFVCRFVPEEKVDDGCLGMLFHLAM